MQRLSDRARLSYYMVFNHDKYQVATLESVMSGEKTTTVRFDTLIEAYMQLSRMVKELEKEIYENA